MTGPSGPRSRGSASVSVVMPVRNGEPYVAEAVESILAQTVRPAEIVVVDDGSEDTTAATLAGFGDSIRVLYQPALGQFAAMNRAVEAARSQYLAFLDADDVFTPTSLEVRLDRISAGDRPDAVFGLTEQFLSPELSTEEAARVRFQGGPMEGEVFQTMLIRRDAFARVGPLAEGLRTSANIDWISRSRIAGLVSVQIDEVVARRRLHRSNVGLTHSDEKRDNLLAVIRAHRQRTYGNADDDG